MTELDKLTRMIGGNEIAPDWLLSALQSACETLSSSVWAEERVPKRKDLRLHFETLATAAAFVRASMRDLDISTLLLDGDPQFRHHSETYWGLQDIERRAEYQAELIPVGRGRNKFFGRSAGLGLQTNCALMIGLIWKRARGEWPASDHKPAQEACDGLWEAAGGPRSGKWLGDKRVSVWRDHLRNAKDAQESPEASHLIRLFDVKSG